MRFCKICNSLYYMKNEGNKLMYYCKRCETVDSMDESDNLVCIKLTDNSESYSTSSIRKNKYIFKDPTLPRVDNFVVKCINNNCLSNLDTIDLYISGLDRDDLPFVIEFFNGIGIYEDNLNIKIRDDEIYEIQFNLDSKKKRQIIEDVLKKDLKLINNKSVNIQVDLIIIIYGLNKLNDELKNYINDEYTNKYNIPIENIDLNYDSTSNQHIVLVKNIDLINYKSLCNDINKKKSFIFNDSPCVLDINFNSEIVYIKYDEVNLKYIYLCSCCNSSWTNNIKVNT
jgi:hypothetical protein